MRGKGKSVGHFESGTCSGTKSLKRCTNNVETDNVVLIDVDSDGLNNVIIIDVPESLKDKLRGSSELRNEKKCKIRTVICIDDDKDFGDDHHGTGTDGSDDFCSDASSSGRFYHAADHTGNTVDTGGEDCQFVPQNLSPWNLSKSKRTYSGRASRRNYYGIVPESDLDSSDDGSSDSEFMEDSFGKLREQWEKANMKKKYDIRNSESGRGDQPTTSGLCTDAQKKVDVQNVNELHAEANVCSSSSNASNEKKNTSPILQSGNQTKLVAEDSSFSGGPCCGLHIGLNSGANVPSRAKDDDVMKTIQDCIIDEREKLKETDEYKRAAEEEWASRQRELKLQAEEAQKLRRLRKRERAECMRLIDMERRQKQRVEEMREIQKKDEENMNLKEKLRAEVRKELNLLECTCHDMASLLRGLGIPVGGGFQPQLHEVRAAYKRALLSFHPDRSSGSDPRQLVEAEEKFKLISRMKEKFLATS